MNWCIFRAAKHWPTWSTNVNCEQLFCICKNKEIYTDLRMSKWQNFNYLKQIQALKITSQFLHSKHVGYHKEKLNQCCLPPASCMLRKQNKRASKPQYAQGYFSNSRRSLFQAVCVSERQVRRGSIKLEGLTKRASELQFLTAWVKAWVECVGVP